MDTWLFLAALSPPGKGSPDLYSVPSRVASGSHHTPIGHKSKSPAQVVFLIRDPQALPAQKVPGKAIVSGRPRPAQCAAAALRCPMSGTALTATTAGPDLSLLGALLFKSFTTSQQYPFSDAFCPSSSFCPHYHRRRVRSSFIPRCLMCSF